jgi:hypothetical protein
MYIASVCLRNPNTVLFQTQMQDFGTGTYKTKHLTMEPSKPFLQHASMTLNLPAVLQAAYTALSEKSFAGDNSRDPSAIISLTVRLQRRIRPFINRALQTSGSSQFDDWAAKVLNPVLDEFDSANALGVSIEDAEYMVLLGTVIILAWEISYLSVASPNVYTINYFLMKLFGDYLCEPEVCCRVAERLRTEHENLERTEAGTEVLQAVWALRNLTPDLTEGTAMWNSYNASPFNAKNKDSAPSIDAITEACKTHEPTPSPIAVPRRAHIQVFLKPGCSWPFDFVNAVNIIEGVLTVKTCIGVFMQVEEGFAVSSISGVFDTVSLGALQGAKNGRAATIIIPPGYAFRVPDIDDVSEVEELRVKTKIETKEAFLFVIDGDYIVQRRNYRLSVLIESTKCQS